MQARGVDKVTQGEGAQGEVARGEEAQGGDGGSDSAGFV